ncbi:hypothetical protein JG688_00010938 [Phytophthora aleatoria]|uniref:Tyrosinase copper-binding domain-containing protein n=1 Tax=Phytophthora aleatoria TaxID=2496075 RepID=A0A8J5M1B8_9STRA|nr:hypothetical protein JG688_00010938 [Phytophthora aleatoria]
MSSSKTFALWLVAALLYLGHSIAHAQQVGTSCSQPRIRKSWDAYTDAEKALYIEAVGVAMDRGFHQKFVQIHTEQVTGLEAHQTCVFIYWHRMLLLGYENMLRSLNTSYECITLPYWDHLSASARQASNNCASVEGCSPMIADFGGTTTGLSKTLSVYGTNIAYSSRTIYAVHNAMGGVMVYFQAPVDPVFYSHHSLIDLLQTIYLKCQNGDEKLFLSTAAKRSDPRFWTSCARSGGGNFSGSDNITMRALAFDGKTYVNVWQEPNNILYPFFKDLPNKYADFVDAKDLGNYSYTYNISGGLANMYENCNDSNTLSAVSLLADEKQGAALKKTKTPLLPTISDGTEDDDSVKLCNIALFETAQILGYNDWAASEQMEMIACAHHGECIGPVDDYSDLFRANFGVKDHTRCFSIMQDLVAGTRIIGIPTWREITRRFLPCPLQDEEDSEESEAAVA